MGISLLSPPKMRVLILMLNYRVVTFKEQDVYKNHDSFKKAMNDMKARGLVVSRRMNGCPNEYKCTDKGQRISDALHELVA